MNREPTQLKIALCWRPIPARVGEEHILTRLLRLRHYHVLQTHDTRLNLDEFDIVLMLENSRWFPTILNGFEAFKHTTRPPLLAVWHWEPLPLPEAAGVPPPSLSARELAKIMLRDARATDVYTNLSHLRRLNDQSLPNLLIVSSQAWQETLANDGIAAHWVPLGYEPADGAPTDGHRDIDALFLGALDVPRRKRIIKQIRQRGVNLVATGSWYDKACWAEERTRLINRAQTFINLQRYPGEISAHRLILGMANKALVVSEPIYRPTPFVPGMHYVEATVKDMPSVLEHYRSHPDERERIIEQAHRFVTRELTMESSISHILSLVHSHRANHQSFDSE